MEIRSSCEKQFFLEAIGLCSGAFGMQDLHFKLNEH